MGALTVDGLTLGRGDRRLLEGVTFRVEPGQAISIHGSNGLGKTTLLRTLAGLIPPLAGALRHDVEAVAYTAHGDAVKASLTVAETLTFWARIYGTTTGVEDAVAAFNLTHIMDRAGATLSAGQRRRCALARQIISRRSIWLMDEPTAALDAAGQQELAAAIHGHLSAGGVAVLVTHGAPPIDCARLDLEPFRARAGGAEGAFAEALE